MLILILSPNQIKKYNWGHQLFRNEIGRQHDVIYYGEGYPNFNPRLTVQDILKQYCEKIPDIILTYGWRYSKDFGGLGQIRSIPKVHMVVDYGAKSHFKVQNEFFSKNKYDLMLGITTRAVKLLEENNTCEKIRFLPFAVDTNVYKKLDIPKDNDVLAAFTNRPDIYPNRKLIQKMLEKMKIKTITTKIFHYDFIKAINRSRICVTSNNIYNSLSLRYTETLACGGFLLADKPRDFSLLGYKDKEHLVLYKDLDDFKDKVLYYLEPENEKGREQIVEQGMKLVREKHSCEVRVKEMTDIIMEEL